MTSYWIVFLYRKLIHKLFFGKGKIMFQAIGELSILLTLMGITKVYFERVVRVRLQII